MGKLRKGHNWKARSQKQVTIDRSTESKICVDIEEAKNAQYDDSNVLALPSEKRGTKVKGPAPPPVKKLSRKEKKRLQKVLEVKAKKLKRTALLEALQSVQVSQEELSSLQSTTQLHNQKHKRHLSSVADSSGACVNALIGSKKRKKAPEPVKPESESETSSSESESSENESESEEMEEVEKDTGKESEEQMEQDQITDDKKTEEEISIVVDSETKKKPGAGEGKVSGKTSRPVTHVPVQRDEKIQADRLKLPILGEEQVIMEVITEHPVTIVCGETGSGKTTQVPQFLYEAGYATGGRMIAVTEPRRVAAISMADRVAKEMSLTSREVSYQIRYEGNVTPDTKIKFMTDGVLLKEVQKDFLLSKYSVVVIDEAHERSMYTDILIGLLSRIVPLRNKKGSPLKLIIMSATLRVEDFTQNTTLFKTPPPVVKVDSRQFPVTIHFNKRTPEEYMDEAFNKVCKIHSELPEGGILVFVTGQQEVHTMCAKLSRMYPYNPKAQHENKKGKKRGKKTSESEEVVSEPLPQINLDDYSVAPEDEQAEFDDSILHDDENEDDLYLESRLDTENDEDPPKASLAYSSSQPLYPLPLYSLLSTARQLRVFAPPPPGVRLCVVATNVAETSITIPGVKYVVDTGKTKTKYFDKVTGVSMFRVTWTSAASGNQRAGRAGRQGPGHCYRLYSSAVFNDDFELFSQPEIVRRPVEDLVLQMKAMFIDKVVNFPFPTPPSGESLKAAEDLLLALGALEVNKTSKMSTSRVTALGKTMAAFPVSPRYGKMLSLGQQGGLLAYVIALVAALSVQELLVEPHGAGMDGEGEEEEMEERRKHGRRVLQQIKRNWAGVGESLSLGDMSVLLHAVGACEYAGGTEAFCTQNCVRYKAMCEVRKLRKQLTDTVNVVLPSACLAVDPRLPPPGELQCKLLRQILLAGLGDRVAAKMPPDMLGPDGKKLKNAYKCTTTNDYVFIHPGSVLYRHQPQYVVYQSLEETSRLYMKGVSGIELAWLPVFASSYCMLSKPLEEPAPSYDRETGRVVCHMTSSYGPHSWPVPAVELPHPYSAECFKWFGCYLLDGSVCRGLEKYRKALLSPPVTLTKSWAKLQPRTESLLRTLMRENVYTRDTLREAWQKNPQYLLVAYKEWLPEALHSQIDSIWPPKL